MNSVVLPVVPIIPHSSYNMHKTFWSQKTKLCFKISMTAFGCVLFSLIQSEGNCSPKRARPQHQAQPRAKELDQRGAAPLSQTEQSTIARAEIVFLLDRSHSMREIISKPLDGDFVCKWDWLKFQMDKFAKETKTLPSGFSVITFNDSYERFDGCNQTNILKKLNSIRPSGGTKLIPALCTAMNQHATTKPVYFIVATDGYQVDPESESSSIMADKEDLSQVNVVFLNVGFDNSNKEYLQDLGELLKKRQKVASVTTVPFETLVEQGLPRVVAKIINSFSTTKSR